MAIAHQQTDSFEETGPGPTVTLAAYAVGAGLDRSLTSVIAWRDTTGGDVAVVNSVVFNGSENFSFGERAKWIYGGDNALIVEVWYLDNPSNATGNIVATISDTFDEAFLAVSEYTGANNGIGVNTGLGSGDADASSIGITTTTPDGLIYIGQCLQTGTTTTSPDNGETERHDNNGTAGVSLWAAELAATDGAQTVGGTFSTSSRRYSIVAVELLAAAAAAAGPTPIPDNTRRIRDRQRHLVVR